MAVSVDLGFGTTCGAVWKKNEIHTLSFPSTVGKYRPLFNLNLKNREDIDRIVYCTPHIQHFIGNLAVDQSPFVYFSMKRRKHTTDYDRILYRTCLGLLVDEPKTVVVSGLPVSTYFEEKEELEQILRGQQEIKLKYGDRNIERNVEVTQAIIYPQPFGTYMNWLLDDKECKIRQDIRKIAAGTIVVIDIGFLTVDYLTITALDIQQEYSRSIDSGISSVYKSMVDDGIDLPLYRIDRKVRAGEYQKERDIALRAFAEQIHTEIETYLPKHVDMFIITGGGGLALFPYLNLPNSTLADDPCFANVKGYLKCGRRAGV